MTIISLKIFNKNSELIRDYYFDREGVNYVYGDLDHPLDESKSNNNIGKTLLLRMIDYIYGANKNNIFNKPEIEGYYFTAEIEYESNRYTIRRLLNSSSSFVNDEPYGLDEYKKKFHIDRSLLDKQIVINEKMNYLGYSHYPTSDDYIAFVKLLGFDDISEKVANVFSNKEKMETINKNKNQLCTLLNIDNKTIKDNIMQNKASIFTTENDIKMAEKTIEELDFSETELELKNEFYDIETTIRTIEYELYAIEKEEKTLKKFKSDSSNNNIDFNTVNRMYKQANVELPSLVVKRIEDVERFFSSIYVDYDKRVDKRLKDIEIRKTELYQSLSFKKHRRSEIGKVLSNNEAYKKAFEIINIYNNKLKELKFVSGQLNQIDTYITEYENLENETKSIFNELRICGMQLQNKGETIQEYLNSLFTRLYGKFDNVIFSIKTNNFAKKRNPYAIDYRFKGQEGDSLGIIKKIAIDLVIYKYTKLLDLYVCDSKCFNGVDPRQVSGLIKEIEMINREVKKQVFVSVNAYQLPSKETQEAIKEVAKVILTENDKLLKVSF